MAADVRRRRQLVWAGGVLVVLLAFVLWWATSRSSDSVTKPSGVSSSTGAATTTGSNTGTPTPGAGSGTATQGSGIATSPPPGTPTNPVVTTTGTPATDAAKPPIPPEAAPVAPTATATGADRVSVSLAKVESVDGKAVAPGEISGPAVRLTVKINNGASSQLDLGLTVVNAYTGKNKVPAGTVVLPGGRPFAGKLAPGQSADGVYLFVIPKSQRQDVSVAVDYGAGVETMVFRGPLG